MNLFGDIPIWLIVVMSLVAIILGRGIRWWLDRRKYREAERLKELQKSEKLRMKRLRKQAKKAEKKK